MGKKYIDIVKYVVEADFEIDGDVEKPDIIGAIFGQTEGLIGADLDLRELQRNGKIGRIEIEFSNNHNNKTSGKLFLPSSLGRVETCILGAAIESVDRVGPFETFFKVLKVEDTRNEKRRHIVERAKNLIKALLSTEIPDSKEISEMVESDVKTSTITNFGPENLPAGPDIGKSEEIILVEGRADVLNLIKNDINNCIAVGGASNNVPNSIIKLATEKETTLFVDGDRGGEMIMKILLNHADIDFIAKAPDGKEVEELARKEIIKALHSKIPTDQAINKMNRETQIKKNNEHFQSNQRNRFHADNNYSREQYSNEKNNEKSDDNRIKSVTEIVNNLHSKEQNNVQNKDQQKYDANQTSNLNLNIKNIDNAENNEDDEDDIPLIHNEIDSDLNTLNNAKNNLSNINESGNELNKIEQQNANLPDQEMINTLKDLQNSLRGRIYDKNNKIIKEIPIRQLIQAIQDTKNINAIVFDGIITQRLVELANKYNIKQLYGLRSQISKKYTDILIYTSENGVI